MHIKDIKLGWITVSDIKKAKSFFQDKLGLKQTAQDDTFGWQEFKADEGFTLGVGQQQDQAPYKPGNNVILTFTVDNIEAAKKHLEDKGVEFKTDIYEVPGHVKLVDFVDSDNNIFQLVEQL